jgi:membrane-bound ClpP family serine protease
MSDQDSELLHLVEQLAEDHDAEVLLYSGEINCAGADRLIELCRRGNRRANVYLCLCTYGGHADAAFRMARALQRSYERFTVHIHGICKSAGTLITIGAHELLLSDFGELGPPDVQLEKDDELFGETISGLNVMQALNSLRDRAFEAFEKSLLELKIKSSGQMTTKSAADVATKLSIGLFAEIYRQIDPARLGEIDRAINIAYAYGERLSRTNGLRDEALATLVTGYPSHGFVIDREEAARLFPCVHEPTPPGDTVASTLRLKG